MTLWQILFIATSCLITKREINSLVLLKNLSAKDVREFYQTNSPTPSSHLTGGGAEAQESLENSQKVSQRGAGLGLVLPALSPVA